MRLIDADVLWIRLMHEPWYDNADRDKIALTLVDDMPTVDAVPVVRCKDCKYVKHWENRAGMSGVGCYLLAVDTRPDSFCSYGERKNDGET